MIFDAVKPVSAGFAVISIRRALPIMFFDIAAFFSGSLVAPDYRRTEDIVVFVEHNKTVHLSRYADSYDVILVYSALLHNSADSFKHGVLPVGGILLCPTVFSADREDTRLYATPVSFRDCRTARFLFRMCRRQFLSYISLCLSVIL